MTAKKSERLTVVASPGAGGGWFATVPAQFGGAIVARTLSSLYDQAEEIAAKMGRALHFDAIAGGALSLDTQVKARDAIAQRHAAEEAQAKAQELLAQAAAALVAAGLSTRDAAVVLEVSHQRVHQVIEENRTKKSKD